MNEPKSARYQRLRRRARLAEIGAAAAWLAVATFVPVSPWLLLAVAFFWEAVLHLREMPIRIGVALGGVSLMLIAMAAAGPWWWLAAGAAFSCAGIAAARLAPALLVRLAATRPVERRTLMAGLREIARRSGVHVSDILEWRVEEGARPTALVTGLGSRCRVFVSAEILRDWSDDEIAVVVAHELAHHVHHDLWRTLALNAVVLSAAFWTAEAARAAWLGASAGSLAGNVAALPGIALVAGVVWLLGTPLRLAQSRAHERSADRFALRLTGEARAFRAAVQRLSERHLAELEPPALVRWFFHRHPPVAERLALAETFISGSSISDSSAARR